MALSRPLLRWHGGKWRLAPWIIHQFPTHRVYVEPFGGAASVLLRKERAYAEVYNDLDDEVVNLFRILRSDAASRLITALRHTPFARSEFHAAYLATDCDIERARRLVIRSYMGFGASGATGGCTGFRSNSKRSHTTPAHDWANYPNALALIAARLSGVVIENRHAVDVMRQHDSIDTLHYVDPPYIHFTRGQQGKAIKHRYRHEMDDASHVELLDVLQGLKGRVVLSGYNHPIYTTALAGWHRIERAALADGARKRVENLWLNFTPEHRGLS